MSPLSYLAVIIENIGTYILILLCLGPIHLLLARRLALSIFDPLFMVILSDWFGFTLVTFMQGNNDIKKENFLYYAASQLSFYAGLLLIKKPNNKTHSHQFVIHFSQIKWILILSALTHITSTVIKWGMTGIPLFNISRLGAFVGSGGLGIIERLETGSFYIFLFSVILMRIRFRSRARSATLIMLLWALIYIAFSGSKSALLGMMQIYFALLYALSDRSRRSFFGSNSGGKAFAIAAAFSVAVLFVQSQGDIQEALLGLAFRLVSFGDIYIYAYIDDTMNLIKGNNPIIGILGGTLSTFRLMPSDWIYKNIGLQLSDIVFPDLDYITGPNPRHNIFGYHFFGWGGLAFSLIIGLIISKSQSRLYGNKHKNLLFILRDFLLYFSLVSIGSDLDYSLSNLCSIIISSIVILIPAQFFYRAGLKTKMAIENVPS